MRCCLQILALLPLNVLLCAHGGVDHYGAHFDVLKVQHQRNVALDEARRRYRERNPEEREDFIVQFWVPAREGDSF